MNTNVKISNLIKGLLLVVISTFIFACSKCEGPVPSTSSNSTPTAIGTSSSSIVVVDKSLPNPKSSETSKGVVGGDDNEDDDDNRGGFPKRK